MNPQMLEGLEEKYSQPFTYDKSITLAGGATGSNSINLQSDARFLLVLINASSDQDAATEFQPNNFKVKWSSQASGREYSNSRIPQKIISNNGNGFRLAQPVILMPNTVINLDWENILAAQQVVASIFFSGYKLYN